MPRGFKNPEERSRKLREAHLGRRMPDEIRKKISITAKKRGVGKWMKGRKALKETIEKRRKATSGEKHWNWKGGITPNILKIRHSTEYIEWRDKVYKRDYWTCWVCGHIGRGVVAHHIYPFSEFPKLRFKISNGITLCKSCHGKVHKPSHWGRNKKVEIEL